MSAKQKYPQSSSTATVTSDGTSTKRDHRKSGKLERKRDRKRIEATQRQVVYEALTPQERLDLAAKRRGKSAREVKRLIKLGASVEPTPAPAPVTKKKTVKKTS